MAEKKAGIIVILSSPSGAGKTTLVKKISARNKYNISNPLDAIMKEIKDKNKIIYLEKFK